MKKSAARAIYHACRRFLFFYIGLVALLFLFQRGLLYHPFGEYAPPTLPGMQEIALHPADGIKLQAWYLPAPEGGKTIIFFHGNGGSLSTYRNIFDKMARHGFGIFAVTYRGYPGSEGSPTESGLYDDGRAAMDYVSNQLAIPAEKRIIMGLSLGSGVAVQIATEYNAGLLALAAPFTSIADVAADIYWYLPAHYMVRDRFDSLGRINRVKMPVYIFHSTDDEIVPYAFGKQLFDAVKGEKRLFTLEKQGHNGLDFNYILQQIKEGS